MNFIHQEYLEDLAICDKLIDYHKTTSDKGPGLTGGIVDVDVKDSIECLVPDYLLVEYSNQLQKVVDNYIAKFEFCNKNYPWSIKEYPNIQYYKPKAGYKYWHCERFNSESPVTYRHLVYMTYLNDVTDQGGTEFYYQNMTIQPKKGLTVIWPADWTHTHRGIVSPTQEKYIITGWFSYHK